MSAISRESFGPLIGTGVVPPLARDAIGPIAGLPLGRGSVGSRGGSLGRSIVLGGSTGCATRPGGRGRVTGLGALPLVNG